MFERSICHHLFDSYEASSMAATFDELADMGYDAVELLGEPSLYPATTDILLSRSGLAVSALTAASRVVTGRDLVHRDSQVRERTRAQLLDCVRFAGDVGCNLVGVSLTAVGRFRRDEDEASEMDRIRDALDWLDRVADEAGVVFSLEVLNRYSSAYLHSPEDDDEISWRRPRVKLTLDTFHLLTELRSIEAIRAWAPDVANVQVSGGARGSVGSALVDPGLIVASLAQSGYDGPVTLEAFPVGTGAFRDADLISHEPVLEIARDFIAWCDRWEQSWHAPGSGINAQIRTEFP